MSRPQARPGTPSTTGAGHGTRGRRSLGRTLLVTSRPVSWINTAYPFAAAYLLSGGRVDAVLVVGSLFFLVPYNLAMYGINDVFDHASDLLNPRKGGVEGALLVPARHRAVLVAVAVAVVPFVVVLVLLGDPVSWLVLGLVLLAVVAYSAPGLRFKEIPFLDSATSSAHFTGPAVYGAVMAGNGFSPPLVLVLVAFYLWGAAAHAFGAVQDVVPDRAGGLSSIATVLGARWTVRVSVGLWTAAGLLMLAVPWPGPLGALVAVPYIVTALPYVGVPDSGSPRTNRGWRRFLVINYVCGFAVTMILIHAATRGA
ncbi:prenyltransferase [Georgenia sp. Z1344]|uniref:prenyltransferase n=1 Tax=Georgenia sp. Z1344 TaxID=3416706 RepID=UPI003CE6C4BE